MRIPQPSIMDTVWLRFAEGAVYLSGGDKLMRTTWWRALLCKHERTQAYGRIDHSAGPGCFADNYEGVCCIDCGKILEEKRTN